MMPTVTKSHSEGRWIFSTFNRPNGQPVETVDHVIECLVSSAKHSDKAELWGVTLDDADEGGVCTVVAYTGNGPKSKENARIAAAAPTMLKELSAIRDELLDAIDGGAECRSRDSWLSELILRCDHGIAKASA